MIPSDSTHTVVAYINVISCGNDFDTNKYNTNWPHIVIDFSTIKVNTCHICQMTAALAPQPKKKLQSTTPPSKTWRHLGVDLIQ